MSDTFTEYDSRLDYPASNAEAVTPSDGAALTAVSRALYVGGAGDVSVTMRNGGNVTFAGVSAGTILPLRVTHVRSTGTDATNIVAVW